MTLLAGTLYDPSTLVTKSTAALLAMTALDTTNLRLSFTVPANGAVLVRLRGSTEGATSNPPPIYLGVLEGSTVRGRTIPMGALTGTTAASRAGREALFVVPGLTPSASLTWDAAYGVETVLASTSLRYGGPNDATTADNANGGFAFEIYDCLNLLGAILYDPGTLVTKLTSSLLAMTAFDTTNLRLTFTAPSTGNVLVRLRCVSQGPVGILLGVLDGSTVRGRASPSGHIISIALDTHESTFIVTGLTPGNSYTWDAAYGVEVTGSSIQYGGPNDATATNAYGAFQYEIWAV